MVMIKLETIDIVFSYDGQIGPPVLDDVSIQLAPSKILGIVGPNGSGKSTLLKCIDKIIEPDHGSVLLDRREIMKMGRMEIAKKIGYVQQTISRGFPTSVFDTVLMGRRPHLSWRSDAEDDAKIWEVLRLLDIEDLALKYFGELSGGQQQRVAIARALANDPEIILADEPTGNLDTKSGAMVFDILNNLHDQGKTIVLITHDPNLAGKTERTIRMQDGEVV